MEVILRQDVPSLGQVGDVVKVADGYGRNFLLPRQKAVVATPGSLKRLEQEKAVIEQRREKAKKEAEELAQKIAALTVSLEKQAGEEDKIFGSVSTREIALGLESQGIVLDKRSIRMKEPIRILGEHIVDIHLHHDVIAPLKVTIVKK